MSLQMQPICLPILPRVGSGKEQDWQEFGKNWQRAELSIPRVPHLGEWGSGLGLGLGLGLILLVTGSLVGVDIHVKVLRFFPA